MQSSALSNGCIPSADATDGALSFPHLSKKEARD